jgi:hypothetical protein
MKVGTSAGSGGRFAGVVLQDIVIEGGTKPGLVNVDGTNTGVAPSFKAITVSDGSYAYQSANGTGVTTVTDGFTVSYASGTHVADAATTTSSPAVTVLRVRIGPQDAEPTSGLTLIWTGSAYPARPNYLPSGLATYQGPSGNAPTDMTAGDRWWQTGASTAVKVYSGSAWA